MVSQKVRGRRVFSKEIRYQLYQCCGEIKFDEDFKLVITFSDTGERLVT